MSSFLIAGECTGSKAWSFGVRVPAESPFFRGHFPGEPVLPAVAHLALLDQLLERAFGEGARLSGLRSLRLRGAVLPDQDLEVQLASLETPGEIRWSVKGTDGPICNGIASWALDPIPREAAASPERDLGPCRQAPSPYLPHQGPALLVQEVLENTGTDSTSSAQVPLDSPFVGLRGGRATFPSYLAIELGAQGAAAAESCQRRELEPGSEPTAGFIVRAESVELTELDLPASQPLTVRASLVRAAPPLRLWRCTVEHEGRLVARADVSTFATNSA